MTPECSLGGGKARSRRGPGASEGGVRSTDAYGQADPANRSADLGRRLRPCRPGPRPRGVTFFVDSTPIVLDASVTVGLLAEDDAAIERAWRAWLADGRQLFAPPLLWLEFANALLRGRRLPAAVVATLLEELEASGIEAADRGPASVRASLDVAERHQLTAYDAAYLWLAIDLDAELAT